MAGMKAIGLDNVLTSLEYMVAPLLGNQDMVKCIHDDDAYIFTGCAAHLLQKLELEHPACHLVTEAIQSYHTHQRAGVKSLVVMTCLWHKQLSQLQQQGIPLCDILKHFHKAVDMCCKTAERLVVHLDELLALPWIEAATKFPASNDVRNATQHGSAPCVTDSDQNKNTFFESTTSNLNTQTNQSINGPDTKNKYHQDMSFTTKPPEEDGSLMINEQPQLGGMVDSNVDETGFREILLTSHPCSSVGENGNLQSTTTSKMQPKNCDTNMVNKPSTNGVDEEEECDWFFDGDTDDARDSDTIYLINSVSVLLSGNDSSAPTLPPSPSTSNHLKGENKVEEVDDEFDCCFDDFEPRTVPSHHSSARLEFDVHHSETKTSEHGNDTHKTTDSSVNHSSLEDEFDSCFDDIPHKSSLSNSTSQVHEAAKVHTSSSLIESFGQLSGSLQQQQVNSCGTLEACVFPIDGDATELVCELIPGDPRTVTLPGVLGKEDASPSLPQLHSLESKLEEQVQLKLKQQCSGSINRSINRSRHFRTIESSVKDLSERSKLVGCERRDTHKCESQYQGSKSPPNDLGCNKKTDSGRNEIKENAVKSDLDKLSCMLKSLKGSGGSRCNGAVTLNQSRHYKTVETSVEHMTLEKSHTQLQSQIDKSTSTLSSHDATVNDSKSNNILQNHSSVLLPKFQEHEYEKNITDKGCEPDVANSTAKLNSDSSCKERSHYNNNSCTKHSHNDCRCGEQSKCKHTCREKYDMFISDLQAQLWRLCERLSHGSLTSHLLAEVTWKQLQKHESASKFVLQMALVHTHHVAGPAWEMSRVVDGFIVSATSEILTVLTQATSHNVWKVVMLTGDVTLTYKHKGQQKQQQTTVTTHQLASNSQHELWIKECLHVLNQLGVNCVLVHGVADPALVEVCGARGVLMLPEIPLPVLRGVSWATSAHPATYLTECTQVNVGCDLQVSPLDDCWMDRQTDCQLVLHHEDHLFQTVVLCHPCTPMTQVREEQFLHSAHRLVHTLVCGHTLPGQGITESKCARQLISQAETTLSEAKDTSYLPAVLGAVAEGLISFTRLGPPAPPSTTATHVPAQPPSSAGHEVYGPSGRIDLCGPDSGQECLRQMDSPVFLDDFPGKLSMWRTSCHLVSQLLLVDKEVVTGISGSEKWGHNII